MIDGRLWEYDMDAALDEGARLQALAAGRALLHLSSLFRRQQPRKVVVRRALREACEVALQSLGLRRRLPRAASTAEVRVAVRVAILKRLEDGPHQRQQFNSLAPRLGCHVRTVWRALEALVEEGSVLKSTGSRPSFRRNLPTTR